MKSACPTDEPCNRADKQTRCVPLPQGHTLLPAVIPAFHTEGQSCDALRAKLETV